MSEEEEARQAHEVYEQTIRAGLEAIDQDRAQREAERREQARQPVVPKAPPQLVVRETAFQTVPHLGYEPGDAQGNGGGGIPDHPGSSTSSGSSSGSSSSTPSSSGGSSASGSSHPGSSVGGGGSSSSSSGIIIGSGGGSSGSSSSRSGSSALPNSSHQPCCSIVIDALATPCDGGTQTIAVSMSASCDGGCPNSPCDNGTGTITINGTGFGFRNIHFAASVDIPCPDDRSEIPASVAWVADCGCPECLANPINILVKTDGSGWRYA